MQFWVIWRSKFVTMRDKNAKKKRHHDCICTMSRQHSLDNVEILVHLFHNIKILIKNNR